MKNILRNGVLLFYYIIQLLILVLSFFTYTSTIDIFPWYEPLTMGPFIGITVITFIQAFVTFIVCIGREKLSIDNNVYAISRVNTGISIFSIVIIIIKENLFYLISKVFAVVECLLLFYFFIAIIKSFIKVKK